MTCSVEPCERDAVARGWCLNHYKKWQRNGTPTPVPPTVEERFFARVSERANGCWEWHKVAKSGYGTTFAPAAGTWHLPHRWSYEFMRCEIPDGLELDHLCRNRRCVNPWHLEPVTRRVNAVRATSLITHCPQGHKYVPENTYVDPSGSRNCKKCRNDRCGKGRRISRQQEKESAA